MPLNQDLTTKQILYAKYGSTKKYSTSVWQFSFEGHEERNWGRVGTGKHVLISEEKGAVHKSAMC